MPKRASVVAAVVATIVLALGGLAAAQHNLPPNYFDIGGNALTISVETAGGQVYHDGSAQGQGGKTCTSAGADDGGGDDAAECWNAREQLKGGSNFGPAEGGSVTCTLVPALNGGQVVFDGVWLDECGVPSNARGRAYTGVFVAMVGSGSAAAGGDAETRGGCVQAFGEDDTPGNLIKTTTDAVQNVAQPNSHTGTDDDTDLTICGDAA